MNRSSVWRDVSNGMDGYRLKLLSHIPETGKLGSRSTKSAASLYKWGNPLDEPDRKLVHWTFVVLDDNCLLWESGRFILPEKTGISQYTSFSDRPKDRYTTVNVFKNLLFVTFSRQKPRKTRKSTGEKRERGLQLHRQNKHDRGKVRRKTSSKLLM